jgi:hypothetical protein
MRTFNLVNWDAHETAFRRLTRSRQITTAKLIHNLANTNRQNFLYYQTSPNCPGCGVVEETFEHVLQCTSPQTAEFRQTQLLDLQIKLRRITTPIPVIDAIMHGFQEWLSPPPHRSRAPTYGSLLKADILVTSAYYEQFHHLGWFSLCLGRISKTWSKAVAEYQANMQLQVKKDNWSVHFISLIWDFTRTLWNNRNQIIYGSTTDEAVSHQMSILHSKVRNLYQQYHEDHQIILPRHAYLFTHRSLEQCLNMSYDSITCWLRSVDESRMILATQLRHMQVTAATMFNMFRLQPYNTASDSDSTYIPTHSSIDTSSVGSGSTATLTDWSTSDTSISSDSNSCNSDRISAPSQATSLSAHRFPFPVVQ